MMVVGVLEIVMSEDDWLTKKWNICRLCRFLETPRTNSQRDDAVSRGGSDVQQER